MNFDMSSFDDFKLEFDTEETLKEACDAGAEILADATSSALAGHRRTGSLIAGVKAGKAKYKPKYGGYYAPILFKGKDENGVPNGLKAVQLEYGNFDQPATPFRDRAVHAAEGRAAEVMERIAQKKWEEQNK